MGRRAGGRPKFREEVEGGAHGQESGIRRFHSPESSGGDSACGQGGVGWWLGTGSGVHGSGVRILPPPLPVSVTLGWSLCFSEPPCLHL